MMARPLSIWGQGRGWKVGDEVLVEGSSLCNALVDRLPGLDEECA
jgi:hypothetical protein